MPNVHSTQREEGDSARTVESRREALRQRMREVQTWALALPGQDQAQSVVDELIASRRAEAQREEDAIAKYLSNPKAASCFIRSAPAYMYREGRIATCDRNLAGWVQRQGRDGSKPGNSDLFLTAGADAA